MIFKIIKFGIVGFTGLIIDFGITWLLKEKMGWNKFLSNSVGFSLAVLNNYYLNKKWTFQDNNPDILHQLFLFAGISITGLLFNNAVVYLLNERKHWDFYFSKIMAIALVFCWNFIMNSMFTFM